MFKKGQILADILIEDAVSDGSGLARVQDCVMFVPGSVPGDIVTIMLSRKEKKFWHTKLISISTPSPDRVQPICAHFGTCGGCKWQLLHYSKQLFYKEKQLKDAIQRIGEVDALVWKPILPNQTEYTFRNKLEFTFSERGWLTQSQIESQEVFSRQALGFHVQGFFDRVVSIKQCFLMDDRVNEVRNAVYDFCQTKQYSFFDLQAQTGLLRQFVVRTSANYPDFMAVLILSQQDITAVDTIFQFLQAKFPYITSFQWIINDKKNDQYSDLPVHLWSGSLTPNPPYIRERLLDKEFIIGAISFFQTNTFQAEQLYTLVKQAINRPVRLLWDLYCGTGSIGIVLASLAEQILGIEYNEASLQDAVRNCEINNVENITFFSGDMAKVLQTNSAVLAYGRPDVVVVDPPRTGMHPNVVAVLNEIKPQQIIYVSCNAATQARDLKMLAKNYVVHSVQGVDMFPQTAHVESVADLWLKNNLPNG
ncbi:MAG: 23S rRNA (uracil(1939)-C(5))-methyltransferase RlmD [Bacteroidia bacterium]|nr:23S rRNA (uracil(1939)-C(5))-methyltransferase RlmD [Bacteroidia bacterium]